MWNIATVPSYPDTFQLVSRSTGKCLQVYQDTKYHGMMQTCGSTTDMGTRYQLFRKYSSITVEPTYNRIAIGLTPGANVYSDGAILSPGFTLSVNDYSLVLDYTGQFILYSPTRTVLWSMSGPTPVLTTMPYGKFTYDGNLCSYKGSTAEFCTETNTLGGVYLNMVPPGSYDRPWGIVIQNSSGRMVWGRFGTSTTVSGFYSLIPGSFLDALTTTNNKLGPGEFITNGRDYLTLTSTGQTQFWVRNPYHNGQLKWEMSNPNGIEGPFTTTIQSNGNICTQNKNGQRVWCAAEKSIDYSRYLYVPPNDGNDVNWGFITHDGSNFAGWGQFNIPVSTWSNYVMQGTSWTNSLNNGVIKVEKSSTFLTTLTYLVPNGPVVTLVPEYSGTWSKVNAWSSSGRYAFIATNTANCVQMFTTVQWKQEFLAAQPNYLVAIPAIPEFVLLNSNGQLIWSGIRDGFWNSSSSQCNW
ncbi:hypothetical protein DFA_05628 [Cavenderia fasciculata]|uniref:Bulb-type lectin domain-containing protein n=1 Tax=Cavenderia fasciculata TaxID=261658 RepID=F4PLS3_CACFS|nr:uncharacterized protein DFA_05628 [Cavenderia fasciculata]EGG23495.1 hypothetical protein DFA_05628 [Cavenderia fasciculata]|eukprot:XP_004361346.1 hypothetical protein DFA_05628 [Cavenderia fasciculata]